MPAKKVTKAQAEEIKKEVKKQAGKEKRAFDIYLLNLKKWIPAQMLLGVFAAFVFYQEFGGIKLIEMLLEWTIGLTIVASLVTALISHYKNPKKVI